MEGIDVSKPKNTTLSTRLLQLMRREIWFLCGTIYQLLEGPGKYFHDIEDRTLLMKCRKTTDILWRISLSPKLPRSLFRMLPCWQHEVISNREGFGWSFAGDMTQVTMKKTPTQGSQRMEREATWWVTYLTVKSEYTIGLTRPAW